MNEIDTDGKPLVDEWRGIQHLKQFRNDIRVLEAMRRFKHKPHEVKHFTDFMEKNPPPNYNLIGGHGHKNISSGKILDPDIPGLPVHLQTTNRTVHPTNGHITYEPIWIKFPSGTSPNTPVNPNHFQQYNGEWYKKKPKQTI